MPPAEDVLYQLAIGLEYIHKTGLIHRNLNPRNVLIWMNQTTNTVSMKWADFGFSKPVNERGSHSMSGLNRGTDNWYAPEILLIKIQLEEENEGDKLTRLRGTVKSDVFAEGLIFGYYLLDGLHPYGYRFQIQENILGDKPVNLESNLHFL
jgi:serine/threonine-protein kinase/endoribonuclease IRE1